jgi:hypothetical protein
MCGEGRPRWILETPRRALMGPPQRAWLAGSGVGEEMSTNGIRDPSLEASHGFHPDLAAGEFAAVVSAAGGGESDLGCRGDVEHVVHLPVPGQRSAPLEEASRGAVPVQDAQAWTLDLPVRVLGLIGHPTAKTSLRGLSSQGRPGRQVRQTEGRT